MPGYKGHVIGGACAFGLLFYFGAPHAVSHSTFVEWLLCATLGSLFPDVDINSKGQKIFFSFLAVALVLLAFYGRWFACGMLGLFSCLPILIKHRGLFHKWWFIIGLPLSSMLILSYYHPDYRTVILWDTYFFVAGIISHLVLDFKFRLLFSR